MINLEIISNISSIDECAPKNLELIFSTGLEVINNYQEACAQLNKTQKLAAHFSDRAKRLGALSYFSNPSDLVQLDMTIEELGVEVVKRIGFSSGLKKLWYGDHGRGQCSLENVKKLQVIFAQDAEDWKMRTNKAERAFEENREIMLIPPDYRYPLALETMLGFVKNLRASTWKECADKYEEQLHRWKMESNSDENLRLQREIRGLTKRAADSATAAAIFSGLNLLLK
jgi:hypothetical protein